MADRLRKYEVVLDGRPVATLSSGQEIELDAAIGFHSISVRIDWCETVPIKFEYDGSDTVFRCGSNLRGARVLLAIWYITFWRHDYLWLRQTAWASPLDDRA